jgi:16S rRNA (cytosine1402-N4)-methyltransferase
VSSSYHVPVLASEVLALLEMRQGQTLLDCTIGGGAHALRLAAVLGRTGRIVGIDQDEEAIAATGEALAKAGPEVILLHGNFRHVRSLLAKAGIERVDGAILDLGVSSHQLDAAERGFSFRFEAPLDMRMDRSMGVTAGEFVNSADKLTLRRIIQELGEERWAAKIAGVIVARRAIQPIRTTKELADIVTDAIPPRARRRDIHPATLTFQSIRAHINQELEALREAIDECVSLLSDGGRIAIIAYQSLEDRIVKQAFVRLSGKCQCPPGLPVCNCGAKRTVDIVTRRPVTAGASEVAANPRARSAKLRVAAKTM